MSYSSCEPPILLAYPTERGNWRVWCSHCTAGTSTAPSQDTALLTASCLALRIDLAATSCKLAEVSA